jgi:hypothetical protein
LPLNSPAPLQSPTLTRSRPDKPAAAATIPHACCRPLQPKREHLNRRYGDVLSSCIDRARSFTTSEKHFLQFTPIFLLTLLAAAYFGFYRFARWVTDHLGQYNPSAEQLITEGRIILCTVFAGGIGAYLRIGLNLEEMRKSDPLETTFVSTIRVICGGIVGLFVYVIVKSQLILKILYLGDVSHLTLDWNGSIALSLLAGLLSNEIVRGIAKRGV